MFVVWYHGIETPLSKEEVEQHLAVIKGQKHSPGGRHDLKALRDFLESDDGHPFYTVNLYKYHVKAQYGDDSQNINKQEEISGQEAFENFSKVMVKLLPRHASHPIFGSSWVDHASSSWDRLVIVRYRSRRDIAKLFSSDEFASASEHKWASLADHERLLIQGLHIPSFYFVVIIMCLLVYVVCFRPFQRCAR